MKPTQRDEIIRYVRGNIISDATNVEISLDWRLRLYFFPKTNRRAAAFHDNILNSRSFSLNDKISLYEKIPYFKKLKQYKKVMGALVVVRKYRNAMAHWSMSLWNQKENSIELHSPDDFSRSIILNEKTIEEYQKNVEIVLRAFGASYEINHWDFSLKKPTHLPQKMDL